MKRFLLSHIHFLFILSTVFLISCGKDMISKESKSTSAALTGQSCGCAAIYMPVCGSDGKNYENECAASCHKVTLSKQGQCIGRTTYKVCGNDFVTYTEKEAQDKIALGQLQSIIQFAACDQIPL